MKDLIRLIGCLAIVVGAGWTASRYKVGPAQKEAAAEAVMKVVPTAQHVDSKGQRKSGVAVEADGKHRTLRISGEVTSEEERAAASRAVLNDVRGVLAISNDLEVVSIDRKLVSRLKALQGSQATPGAFDYEVDGNTVILKGWVPEDEADVRESLEALVAQMPGVREVINDMELGPPEEREREALRRIYEILRLGNIYFDFNKATIRSESLPSLAKIAAVLLEPDTASLDLVIEGHTDSVASKRYNQGLSERRAAAVKAALIENGVAASRLTTIGYGETRPVANNATPEGRAENRRIEFRLASDAGTP
ncbi:MAG: OmpA family protein [Acidobacteriota bacterium]